MCNRKRLKKLQKYIQLSELSKFRSYAKRHSVDVIGLLDEHGNSLIHLSCMYGCEVILRYLLKKEVNVLLKNNAGDLPIHLACQYAQQGHKHAETDLVLPLIRKNASCLDVKNNDGCTARELLQDFKDRMNQTEEPEGMCDETSLSCSSSESDTTFEEKLAREMADEYSTEWGIFEEDYYSYEREYETWNAWADRMAKEYATRRHSSVATSRRQKATTDASSTASGASDIPRISARKRKLFDEKAKAFEEECRRETTGLRKLRYERNCIELYKPGSSSAIGYNDVPWPHPAGKESPLKQAVAEFLFGDLEHGSDTYRSYLRLQRIRWHPDRFAHRCGGRLKDSERGKILDKVKAVSQILNSLHETL